MFEPKITKIPIKKIADFLKSDFSGKNIQVSTVSSLDNIKNNSVLFYSKMSDPNFNIKDTVHYDLKKLKNYKNIVLICDKETNKLVKNIPTIISKNPRLDFSRIMMKFFVSDEFKPNIHRSSIIEKTSSVGKNVYIGPHCYIGKNVKIGNNVKILSNTSIFGRTRIGKNCLIAPNSVVDVGVKLGDKCLVGSASLVRKNFPKNSVLIGSPARILRKNNWSVKHGFYFKK